MVAIRCRFNFGLGHSKKGLAPYSGPVPFLNSAKSDIRPKSRMSPLFFPPLFFPLFFPRKDGQVSSDSIQRRAIEVDISYGTLRRASKLLECKVRKQNNQWFWSLPDQSEARCANVTDSKNGVLVYEAAGNRQELGLDLLGKDPGGELAVNRENALVS